MLDVAIGLIFLYLVLSLICSAVAEILESLLKNRAKDLEKGIRTLLQDPEGKGLAKSIYEHPLIYGLYSGSYNGAGTRNLPSYIPSRSFALAMMDLVLPATTGQASGAAGATNASQESHGGSPAVSLPSLRDAIATVENASVARALRTLVDAAGDDIDRARKNIEEWFDSSMERVSGWYKRRAQWLTFLLGLGVAFAMNADTIAIGSSLARDKAVRESVVAFARKYAETVAAVPTDEPKKKLEDAMAQIGSVSAAGLPLGWDASGAVPKDVWPDWLIKVIGFLATAFAISLGAPFWFDLLKRFVSVRAAGKLEPKADTASRNQGSASGES
jgi:hypothetical protein